MKLNKHKLAKILAELPHYWTSEVIKWESLPFHRKLTYIGEAERIIKALRVLKKGEKDEKQ